MNHLYQWAKDNWGYSCHAGGCEARAQYLEMCIDNDDDDLDVNENDGWDVVKDMLWDYGMPDILDNMVKDGSIYTPEERCGYGKNGYGWMLDAVGYDMNGIMDVVKEWLDDNEGYDNTDEIRMIIAKDYYDMWDEEV